MQMGGVVRYRWEAYCDSDTDGRNTGMISLSSALRGTDSSAKHIGRVSQCELEDVYRSAFSRSGGRWGL